MSGRIVLAVDHDPTATAVIRTGKALAALLDADVVAVHARENDPHAVRSIVAAEDVDLEVHDGDPTDVIVDAVSAAPTIVGVCGCRAHRLGPRPGGHTALEVLGRSPTPIVVVPPEFGGFPDDKPRRVLAPLDGTERAAGIVRAWLDQLADAGSAVTVLHVLGPDTVPPFLDQPHHAIDAWQREFLARYANTGFDIVLRVGEASAQVLDALAAEPHDLVAVGWSRDIGPGRAEVVRALLARSPVPVLLVPEPGPS